MPLKSRRVEAAVLYPGQARDRITVGREPAPDDLAGLLDYAWWVRWDAPEPHVQPVIPRPAVHLSVEELDGRPRVLVHGVHTAAFEQRLVGQGMTVALAFRPAGFRPVLGRSVTSLRGRVEPLAEVLGDDDVVIAERALAAGSPQAGAAVLVEWLRGRRPLPLTATFRLAALVERAEEDAAITRAEQLAELAGVGLRTLQRQFVDHVGIGPKWVVQRSRLLDVAAAANSGREVDWAGLAADLGYADQSHLIRGFTALVGRAPATYAAAAGTIGPTQGSGTL